MTLNSSQHQSETIIDLYHRQIHELRIKEKRLSVAIKEATYGIGPNGMGSISNMRDLRIQHAEVLAELAFSRGDGDEGKRLALLSGELKASFKERI